MWTEDEFCKEAVAAGYFPFPLLELRGGEVHRVGTVWEHQDTGKTFNHGLWPNYAMERRVPEPSELPSSQYEPM